MDAMGTYILWPWSFGYNGYIDTVGIWVQWSDAYYGVRTHRYNNMWMRQAPGPDLIIGFYRLSCHARKRELLSLFYMHTIHAVAAGNHKSAMVL